VGITAGSREVPGRNACDRRHTYCIIIIIIIIIILNEVKELQETAILDTARILRKILM